MKSKTYIVSWDEVVSNTKDIADQMARHEHSYTVIDVTTVPTERPNWERTGTVRYYNHFIWALTDFINSNYDIFVFNAGDISFDSFGEYTSKAERIFSEDSSVWLLAPNCGNDQFTNEGAKIVDSKKEPGLYLATQTNGIWVFFSRDMAASLYEFLRWSIDGWRLDFTDMVSGWGLDTVYCGMAIYNNKKVYRDASVIVSHPKGSTYDYNKAEREYYDLVYAYLDYVAVCGENQNLAGKICQMSFEKVNQRQNLPLSIEKVYANLAATLGEI
jgi:hypothetical protein